MRYLILCALVVLTACTQTPQKKAEAAVKKFMKDNANDPSSYQPLEFSTIDSVFEKQ
jgi:hypothetical protein